MVKLGTINDALLEVGYDFMDKNDRNQAPIPSRGRLNELEIFGLNHSFEIIGSGADRLHLLTKKNPSNFFVIFNDEGFNSIELGKKIVFLTDNSQISDIKWPFVDLAYEIIKDSCKNYNISETTKIRCALEKDNLGSKFYTIIEDPTYGNLNKENIKDRISALVETYSNFNKFLYYLDNKVDEKKEISRIYEVFRNKLGITNNQNKPLENQ